MSLQVVSSVPTVQRRRFSTDLSAREAIALHEANAVAMRCVFKVLSPEWLIVVEKRSTIDERAAELRAARLRLIESGW